MTPTRPHFSLVVPTYNELENIVPFLESAHAALAALPHEIIVVDDDSPDGTWRIASEFTQEKNWVRVFRRLNERDLSTAVLKGFSEARGEILGVMDADQQHDESILPKLIAAIQKGADMAIATRYAAGGGFQEWPWYRKFLSRAATVLGQKLLNIPLSDPLSGYFVLTRSLYDSCKVQLKPEGYKILLELYAKSRPKTVVEVPYVFRNRLRGDSKVSSGVAVDYLKMLLRLKRDLKKES